MPARIVRLSFAVLIFPMLVGSAHASPLTYGEAARFLEQATWGPSAADIVNLQNMGLDLWFDAQANAPVSAFRDLAPTENSGTAGALLLTNAVNGADQLCQRMSFTLSQIWVVSTVKITQDGITPYLRVLQSRCLSNYRDVMEAITLSPSMGYYLDLAGSRKADPKTGLHPNENYARELLQLFTLGTVLLNSDGTPRLDSRGQQISTYSQHDIQEIARALTGWRYSIPAGKPPGHPYFSNPLVPVEAYHDTGFKLVLGHQVNAGQMAREDLKQVLDIIFQHPNLGPFVSVRLIQHFTTSNPSPAYVQRVAGVFNNNGRGVRGDLKAVIRAILLDPEAREGDNNPAFQIKTGGHLREPILFTTALMRALNVRLSSNNSVWTWWLPLMGQTLFAAASVFNYYSPFYNLPGNHLLAPEFALLGSSQAIFRANFVDALLENRISGVSFDPGPYAALAGRPGDLLDAVDMALLRGQMPAAMRAIIRQAVDAAPDADRKAKTALYLAATSNLFQVEH